VKVLFIYPNLYAQIGFNYGIAFLSAALKAAGHETALINVNDQLGAVPDERQLLERVAAEKPAVAAFSVVTNQYRYATEMAGAIKRAFPETRTIIGGVHATMDPEGCLAGGVFDYVCVGEGEDALLELVEAMEKGGDTTAIRNIWTRCNGRTVSNPVRPFIPLERLPRKDYDIFDFQKMIDAKDGWVGLMASRGCPFRCTYCFNHRMVSLYRRDTGLSIKDLRYVRHHSVDEVIDEIEYLLSHYRNIRTFIFDDDLFTFDREYVKEFCERYRNLTDIPFVCNAHVRFMDDEIAAVLARGGCSIVKFGLESGSERVRREVMRRPMTNEQIERAFAAVNGAGLHSSAFVMMGLPTETPSEMDETVELLARIRPGRFRWAIFFPYINTDAYDMAAELGIIDFEKMRSMPNFTDDSCLQFGAGQNLRIRKFQAAYPWYVNARSSDGTVGRLFSRLVHVMDSLDGGAFDEFRPQVASLDALLARVVTKAEHDLYSLRYNTFTAVCSRWED
jgi:radical SAM superfamily enzyme YgiQ (UPF0313 family)